MGTVGPGWCLRITSRKSENAIKDLEKFGCHVVKGTFLSGYGNYLHHCPRSGGYRSVRCANVVFAKILNRRLAMSIKSLAEICLLVAYDRLSGCTSDSHGRRTDIRVVSRQVRPGSS